MRVHKVIVTNATALRRKYGDGGLKAIRRAVNRLIIADKNRGLITIMIALDDAARIKKFAAPAVIDPADAMQNKTAIDTVYRHFAPDYLMILGSIDIVPHQDLKNPLYSPPNGDTDVFAHGDLPYACEAPHSPDIRNFTGPTRVIGRLPDVTGANDPRYLLELLKTAAGWRARPRSGYQDCLGISAQKWEGSTSKSLIKIFDSDMGLQTCPKRTFRWRRELLRRRMHFINCHGDSLYSRFVGQSAIDENDMPISHDAAYLAKTGIEEGTVAAAECCFGGELYDPSAEHNKQIGICNTYLWRKAYGFFASTNSAFGQFKSNDYADLICRYFMQSVLAGASLGRAALEARQKYVAKKTPLNMTDQKTLAQFNLYADPSIVPVETAPATGRKVIDSAARSKRRDALRALGAALGKLQPELRKIVQPEHVASSLQRVAGEMNLEVVDAFSFRTADAATTAFHVCVGIPESTETTKGRKIRKFAVLEAKEVDGSLIVTEGHYK